MTNFEKDRKLFFDSFPGLKTFQLFDDTPAKRKEMAKIFHTENLPVSWERRLEKLNCDGVGVYMCINETDGTGRTNKSVVKVRAVFADFDGEPIEPAYDDNPSMIVETSPGRFHAYFFTDLEKQYVPKRSFSILQEAIAEKYNSDASIKDLARVMRVPGFYHNKREPFLSRIVHYNGNIFEYGLLVEMFPPIPRPVFSGERWKKAVQSYGNQEFKGQYGASKPGRNVHLMKRIGGMIKKGLSWFEIENEAMKEALACSPPLSESETHAVLRSAKRYTR